MIKLNNKNITYVALADSSNSIKAPKEIWYADSNNSVKLVYRRKDALIEGGDYEKYHWLVGDADAYINTLKYYRPYDDSVQMTVRDNLYPNRVNKYNKHNAEEQIWGGSMKGTVYSIRSYISGTEDNSNKISNNILDASTTDGNVNWGAYAVRSFINASPEHSLYISSVDSNTDKYYFIYNGDTKDNLSTRYTLPELIEQDVLVFYNASVTNGYFNGSFFNFIHYRNNVEITHLIPCKLLKPVPKWLDANGIRRQVGECGMIDLVSGKFYGNVNSVGTFTVENYYERKEWLVGDGSAYIDTKITSYTGIISTKYNFIESEITNNESAILGRERVDYTVADFSARLVFCLLKSTGSLAFQGTNKTVAPRIQYLTTDTIDVDVVNNTFTTSTQSGSVNIGDNVVGRNLYLFASNGGSVGKIFNGKIAYLRITDSLNLIPCTLTMDLPASMDANNIARTKGTSGMWDLVSDRFYGNVANSGTFKAVNLAEGVDYEVHQWLVGDGTAYINTQIPTSKIVDYDITFQDLLPLTYQEGIFGTRKNASEENLSIMTLTSQGTTSEKLCFDFGDYVQNRVEIVDDFNEHRAKWNGAELFVDGVKVADRSFVSQSSRNALLFKVFNYGGDSEFHGKIANLTISGKCNFTPCKLLRSIPSKYDANGIARNAGECGMYDTVNDVFYGNVASSGTFSVSDDS